MDIHIKQKVRSDRYDDTTIRFTGNLVLEKNENIKYKTKTSMTHTDTEANIQSKQKDTHYTASPIKQTEKAKWKRI